MHTHTYDKVSINYISSDKTLALQIYYANNLVIPLLQNIGFTTLQSHIPRPRIEYNGMADYALYNTSVRKSDSKKPSIQVLRGSIKKINKSIEYSNLRSHHIFKLPSNLWNHSLQVLTRLSTLHSKTNATWILLCFSCKWGHELISYNNCKTNEKLQISNNYKNKHSYYILSRDTHTLYDNFSNEGIKQ